MAIIVPSFSLMPPVMRYSLTLERRAAKYASDTGYMVHLLILNEAQINVPQAVLHIIFLEYQLCLDGSSPIAHKGIQLHGSGVVVGNVQLVRVGFLQQRFEGFCFQPEAEIYRCLTFSDNHAVKVACVISLAVGAVEHRECRAVCPGCRHCFPVYLQPDVVVRHASPPQKQKEPLRKMQRLNGSILIITYFCGFVTVILFLLSAKYHSRKCK